jgi:ubiquinone/menaquinone biosynthesis C-methylase UbiE
MGLFKRGLPAHQTALAMIGAKAGQSVIFFGSGNLPIGAEVGRITGLNGRTVLVDTGAAIGQAFERAAARAGALVEFIDASLTAVPGEASQFDVAVIIAALAARADDERLAICREAYRLIRPGGRVVIIEGRSRGGLFRGGAGPTLPEDEARSLLERCGALAARRLADAEQVTYDEARKPAPAAS